MDTDKAAACGMCRQALGQTDRGVYYFPEASVAVLDPGAAAKAWAAAAALWESDDTAGVDSRR